MSRVLCWQTLNYDQLIGIGQQTSLGQALI